MPRKVLIVAIIFLSFVIFLTNNQVFSFEQAVLYFEPSSGSFRIGETFQIAVKVDTKGNTINSARGIIDFPPDKIEVLDIGKGKSIFVFWDNTTSFSNSSGEITFGGGLPSPGFSGASGQILRPTFRVKKVGVAIIEFKEAAVLANDEKGTDVLGRLEKGSYELETEVTPVPSETPFPAKELEPPKITTYSKEISSTEILYLEGSALSDSTVILYIEKEDEEPIIKEIDSSPDGSWSYIHDKFLQPGKYSIYAKVKIKTGEISDSSKPIEILVKAGALNIWRFSIKNETLYGIITLLSIVTICILFAVFVYLWHQGNKNRKKLVKEIKEADESVVNGFWTLKEEVRRELNILQKMRITEDHLPPKEKKERRKILDDLLEDLELLEKVEKYIKKEIKDIEDILPG